MITGTIATTTVDMAEGVGMTKDTVTEEGTMKEGAAGTMTTTVIPTAGTTTRAIRADGTTTMISATRTAGTIISKVRQIDMQTTSIVTHTDMMTTAASRGLRQVTSSLAVMRPGAMVTVQDHLTHQSGATGAAVVDGDTRLGGAVEA